MANYCSWCGEKIGFLDIAFTYETVGKNKHSICGECSAQIMHAKAHHTPWSEIKTDKTNPELLDYFIENTVNKNEEKQEIELRNEQQKIKKDAQQVNPLYDDIHQIAGDLRFIKNYLIFTIIVGIIVGLLVAFSI